MFLIYLNKHTYIFNKQYIGNDGNVILIDLTFSLIKSHRPNILD